MAYPYGSCIVGGHTCKVHAAVIRVGTGLARHCHAGYFRVGTSAGVYRLCEYIHQHISRGLLKYGMLFPYLVSVEYDLAAFVHYPRKGQRFLILAPICNRSVCRRHLYGGYVRGAQRHGGARLRYA